jgi:hypothetical protein
MMAREIDMVSDEMNKAHVWVIEEGQGGEAEAYKEYYCNTPI